MVGVEVLVFRDKKVLLGKRANKKNPGWALPGGRWKIGETVEECAARELWEETGMRAAGFKVIGAVNGVYPDGERFFVVYTKAMRPTGEPMVKEIYCSEWKWFNVHSLPKPLFLTVKTFLKQKTLEEMSK